MDNSVLLEQLFIRIVSQYQDALDKDYATYLVTLYRYGRVVDALASFIMVLKGLGYSVSSVMRGELGQLIQAVAPDLLGIIPSDQRPAPQTPPQFQAVQSNTPTSTVQNPQIPQPAQSVPRQPPADDGVTFQIQR